MFGEMPIALGLVWVFIAGLGLGFAARAMLEDLLRWDASRRLAGLRPVSARKEPPPAERDTSRAAGRSGRPRWQYSSLRLARQKQAPAPVRMQRVQPARPHYDDPYLPAGPVRPLAGHPVLEGAGYDCCCGACLAQLGYLPRVMPPADRVGAGSAPWSPAVPPASDDPYDLDRAAGRRRRARGRLPAADESGSLPAVVPGVEPTALYPGSLYS